MIKRIGFAGFAAVLALTVMASAASAQTLRGTVVHRNARAHSFVVANSRGALSAVHARKAPALGRVVKLNARRLRNGTFALRSAKLLGRTRHARISGTVTFARRGEFVVSAPGTSMLVQQNPADSTQPPSVGDQVQVDGTIDDQGDIQEQDVKQTGTDTNGMDLEGKVLAVDTTARTLSISADDEDRSGSALTVNVPASFDITKFAVGQEVELTVTPNTDGSFTLVGSAEDGNSGQANDQHNQQGDDQNSDQGDQGDQQDQQQQTQGGQDDDSGDHHQSGSDSGSSTGTSGSTSPTPED